MTKMSPCVPVPKYVQSSPIFMLLEYGGRTREVMPPQRSYLVLSTHVPHVELNVLVRNGLNVEADCRDRCDILV